MRISNRELKVIATASRIIFTFFWRISNRELKGEAEARSAALEQWHLK